MPTERNYYRNNPPDFAALGALYPDFGAHVIAGKGPKPAALNWRDPAAVMALTKVLLLHDFGLTFSMPIHHLCPPVPQRLNYLLWVEDLLALMGLHASQYTLRGIDIGTGASCIFPLLGIARNMSFVATEIDPESVGSAQENVVRNNLADRISVRLVTPDVCLGGVVGPTDAFEFCVCNPPFFESLEETGLNSKRACLATASELTCPGGELAFINRMIDDSIALRFQVRWFTTMLGKKATLAALTRRLHHLDGVCY